MKRSIVANFVSSLRRRALWVALGAVGAPVLLSGVVLRGDEPTAKPAAVAPLSAADVFFRGAERATAGQRFTLEVFIVNTGNAPLKNLEFVAQLDESLEHASKNREQRVTIESIAVDDLHIVRLPLTPRKSGPAGMEITLKGGGQTQRLSYVAPVAAADTPRPPHGDGAPLKFKITSLRESIADRPGVVLVNVLNTDSSASKATDLVVSYGTLGRDQVLNEAVPVRDGAVPLVPPKDNDDPKIHRIRDLMRVSAVIQHNPTRRVNVSLPSLEPGESMTLPVRVMPRRIGELGVAVTAKSVPAVVLGSARLSVAFDPKTPVESLLPARAGAKVPAKLPTTLAEVPEVSIEDPHAKGTTVEEGFEHIAHLVEKIKHVNQTKTDAYMEAMVKHRSDVRGLPFSMGDACRLPAERGQHFQGQLGVLRQAMADPGNMAARLPNPAGNEAEAVVKARISALSQVIEPESQQLNLQMVKYLKSVSHIDATRVLARLAVSAGDPQVRSDAIDALSTRREKDYGEVLVAGLSYPWPAVAEHASEAIVKLKQKDLAEKLIDMLERPDPRAPQTQEKDGKQVTVVREMVRVNHLRNCLLCHSPASTQANGAAPAFRGGESEPIRGGRIPAGFAANGGLTAPVPLPNQALPQPTVSGGYGQFSIQDTLVQFDVTYLRQDFSVKLPVAGAAPWPDQQRFDFLVRTRELSEKDAEAYRALFPKGEQTPYQRAALAALRQLTGRDAEPTAAAWRQVLAQK